KSQPGEIHRQRTPPDPAVVNQTHDNEGEKSNDDPVRLLTPKLGGKRILPHIGRAIDRDYAKGGEGKHDGHEQPVKPENLSEKWSHLVVRSTRVRNIYRRSKR